MRDLSDRWTSTWKAMGIAVPGGALYRSLIAAYCESQRKYHTLQHLEECFDVLDASGLQGAHHGEIEIALWFHDAVYDVRRSDNEQRSAQWACEVLEAAAAPEATIGRVADLVMATRHHLPSTSDEQLLVDVDLAILGAAPERFGEYDRQIREEYSHVDEALFNSKRAQVLEGFLQRGRIFGTEAFYERYERQARLNLALALGALPKS
jgi:predicted metal-dependent HD superfamily phosphohydrolase